MMGKNAIATTTDEADAFELAAEMRDMVEADAGVGSENVTANDISIPYLSIIQKGSPEFDADDAQYIPEAKPGMIFQNVNKYLWPKDEGVQVVNCAYDRKIIEWIPRESGGGLVAVHELNTPLMKETTPNDKKVPTLSNGHNLIDTSTHFVLYKNWFDMWEPAIISMKSTAQKKSRLWNALIMQQFIPGTRRSAPRWLFKWTLTTVLETKEVNNWYNWDVEKSGVVDVELYNRAKSLNEQFKAGALNADAAAAAAKAGAAGVDDEIPF